MKRAPPVARRAASRSLCLAAIALSLATLPAARAHARDRRLRWNDDWTRISVAEAITTGVLAAAVAAGELLIVPDAPHTRGGILLDDAVRVGLRLDSSSARRAAATTSDVLAVTLLGYPLLVDATFTAWGVDRNRDVALQMLGIDALSVATTAFLLHFTKNVVARERPFADRCDEPSSDEAGCDGHDRFRSFFSGHTAYAFTGAALICVHHANLPLYGGGAPDAAACVAAAALATTVGILRILADRHWLTDVLVGALVGAASGILLPSLLHYGFGWHQADGRALPPGGG